MKAFFDERNKVLPYKRFSDFFIVLRFTGIITLTVFTEITLIKRKEICSHITYSKQPIVDSFVYHGAKIVKQ